MKYMHKIAIMVTSTSIICLENCFGVNEANYGLAFKIPEAEGCAFQFVL